MLALAQDVSTRTGVSLDHIGVAIWEPKWTRSGRRLICAGAERRGYKPAQSGIRWRVGKGVIGTCVKARKDAVADLEQLDEEFRKLTRREWNGLPRDERLGLRAREMERARGKYSVVLASPIFAGDKVAGCIALDFGHGVSRASVDTHSVWEAISDAAEYVGTMVHG